MATHAISRSLQSLKYQALLAIVPVNLERGAPVSWHPPWRRNV